jgi:hypothetical protein
VRRLVAVAGVVLVVILLFGAAPTDLGAADPVHAAALRRMAVSQAAAADASLAEAEELMTAGTAEASRGQAAALSGDEDPATFMDAAAAAFEAAAEPVDMTHVSLEDLRWTLLALDPDTPPPTLELSGADLTGIGAQWRATALPLSAIADLRRAAEATLEALDDALAALDDDDPAAALDAVSEAEASLDVVRASARDLSTLPVWVDTVEALLDATADIARAAQTGDADALAEAQAAFDEAADDAARADQALTIALGEAAAGITGPASAASAAARRAVGATRAALAGLSILP